MTDAEFLYWLLLGFYLFECAFWVRTGAFIFVSQLGERPRRRGLPWAFLRNPHGGLLFGNLVPTGRSSLVQAFPLSIAPTGIYGYAAQVLNTDGRPAHEEKFVLFEDVSRITAQGDALHINGAFFARTGSPLQAGLLAAKLRELHALPPEDRGIAIAALLDAHFDVDAVRARVAQFKDVTADLQLTCLLLFFLVYIFPPIYLFLAPYTSFLPFVAGYFGLVFLAQLQYREAARLLVPDEKGMRRKQLALMLISPADATHARNRLARELLACYHPLAVSLALEAPDRSEEFAAHVWRDLAYPMQPTCWSEQSVPRAVEAWYREQLRDAVGRLLTRLAIDPDEALAAPPRDAPASLTYCLRCHGQFELPAGVCHHCGQPLLPCATADHAAPEKAADDLESTGSIAKMVGIETTS